jgi:hypothetical protein
MKVYHPETGAEYEGHPVDCRELRQAGWLDSPPEVVEQVTEVTRVESQEREFIQTPVSKPATKKVRKAAE